MKAAEKLAADRDVLQVDNGRLKSRIASGEDDLAKALEAAGRMSDLIVLLVGGRTLNGFPVPPATVMQLPDVFRRLDKARGDYDAALMRMHERAKT